MERVLFDHAVAEQRMFEIESNDYVLMKFLSFEKRQKSIDEIKERESQNIYHYLIEPIEHEEKPEYKEKLKIKYP